MPHETTPPAPSAGDIRQPGLNVDEFRKRLSDEYKILQDKIDKIGGFRFTIKGWSVTLATAATATSATTTSMRVVCTLTAAVIVLLVLFFITELGQVRLSRHFGDRARRLEDAFSRLERERRGRAIKLPFPVPFVANEIAAMSVGRPLQRTGRLSRARVPVSVWSRKGILAEMRVWRQSDLFFYLFLAFIALLPLVPRYASIHQRLTKWVQEAPAAVKPLSRSQTK